jgi:hypothetical protein
MAAWYGSLEVIVASIFRALLRILAIFVAAWLGMTTAFRIVDMLVKGPNTWNGVILAALSCGALGGLLTCIILFGSKYAVGRIRRLSHSRKRRDHSTRRGP